MAGPDAKLVIRIADSSGHPVPFVTVWGTTDPAEFGGSGKGSVPWQQLSMEDLWRVALRYKDSFESAQLAFSPVDGLTIIGMSNSKGIFRQTIDADSIHASALPTYRVLLVFMKRGYLPEKAVIEASSSRDTYSLTTVMKPDPEGSTAEEQEYLKTFDRIRFELSDDVRNERLTNRNLRRLADLRSEMAKAAESALSSGNRKAAARILARMETMPGLRVIDGRIVGYDRMDFEAPESRAAIEHAVTLDPDNDYLALRGLRERGRKLIAHLSRPMTDDDREAMRAFVGDLEAAMAAHGEHAWMFDRVGLVYDYIRLGLYEKAYREITKLREFAPHGADYDYLLRYMKFNMSHDKIPVPANWK